MVDGTVSFALERLSDFLTQEVQIRIGVKDGVRWLKDELAYLQSSVRYAEAREEEELIRIWINNVRDVADDAITILDKFSILQQHAAPEQGVLDRLRNFICICKKEANLYDIGKEIESLKERVVGIKNRREEYGISNILATSVVPPRIRTLLRAASFQNQVDVVGFEDDFRALLAELVKEDPSLNMISIHGMGGLGKTTLASKLYYSSELSHFRNRAWVCVSQAYDIKNVLRMIIKSFMRHGLGHELNLLQMDVIDLLHHLRKLLVDCDSYLAIIDDIWDINAWENIKKAFPDNKNGSRVIVTTRNRKVAQKVDDRCFVHELRFLREDESWSLFYKRAKPTSNLEKLGKEMVSKCGGLPLAIVVLSGLLLHKKSYIDWSAVKDHIWRHLKKDSIEIEEILSLSYNDLSFQMRQCFLYLARFPEDYTFVVDKLKLLWIAENFISEDVEGEGVVMEDVAEDCLHELINRNMIQIVRLFGDGQVGKCRMHDLVRDLAIQQATKDRLLGIFDLSRQHPSPIHLLQGKPIHAIVNGIGEYLRLLGPSFDNLKLRSLGLITGRGKLEIEEVKLMCTRFKYLKVLDLRGVHSEEILEEIGHLILLKFLGLMCGISGKPLVIPQTTCKLKKLQTLCGSQMSCYEFPKEICELGELRHLNFHKSYQKGSLKIGSNQTKLQTISAIWYSDWIKIHAVNLINLRSLAIKDDRKEAAGSAYSLESLSNLTSLQKFELDFFPSFKMIPTIKPLSYCKHLRSVNLWGKMNDPSELSFLPDSVTVLSLGGTEFTQDPMPTLGSMSNLITLEFNNNVYMGEKMVCCCDAFPCLEFFSLEFLFNLKEWQVEDGALPSLKGINISNCERLKMVPQRLKCLPHIPNMWSTKFWDWESV